MRRTRLAVALLAAAGTFLTSGCYFLQPSKGGGDVEFSGLRAVTPSAIALPAGYRIQPVARKLNFPTAVAFDAENRPYVLEAGYSYGEVFTKPRLLRVEDDGQLTEVLSGENGPWTGVTFYQGAFYLAEGGAEEGGAILRYTPGGEVTRLVEGLPSMGDHHTNGPVIRDGYLYFAVGTATNSGVVGEDNYEFGWLKRHPEFCDIPAKDVQLIGKNYQSDNPLTPEKGDKAFTGAFLPFGTPGAPGQIIKGRLPCTGAVMRVPVEGGPLELVAWGFRNPFGMAFTGAGELYVTENQFDTRGSRPIWGAGDVLWKVEFDRWYGWPDYHAGLFVDADKRYKPPGDNPPEVVLAQPPGRPPLPAATLAVHGSASGLDFSTNGEFGYLGNAFIAEFGDMSPDTGKVLGPVGFDVVRVDVHTGAIERFAVNRAKPGPASLSGTGGLERPVAVKFDNTGLAMYIVDFGAMTMKDGGPRPYQNTGVLWRVTREGK